MAKAGHIVGYARVSSSGQSLEVQVEKLSKHGCDKIYQEKISGLEQNRPQLIACLDYVREGDTLVITKLDRMARSSLHLGKIVENLNKKKVNFIVLDQQIDTTSPQGKLMFHMLSAFAEFENGIRRERQVEGIEKAKRQGTKFGRKFKLTPETVKEVELESKSGKPVKEILDKFDIARVTYYKIKNGNHPYQVGS
ncbi:recombinase family protein [Cysteiniphilum sp. 19S12-1]|uniref:recombinase family protein n=1 Tax=Cysteiniphilum sp. 19S12-1 TaxID=3453130 RepID=UPI003F8754F6